MQEILVSLLTYHELSPPSHWAQKSFLKPCCVCWKFRWKLLDWQGPSSSSPWGSVHANSNYNPYRLKIQIEKSFSVFLSWKQTFNSLPIPPITGILNFFSLKIKLTPWLSSNNTLEASCPAPAVAAQPKAASQALVTLNCSFHQPPFVCHNPLPTEKPLWTYSLLCSEKMREESWEGKVRGGGAGSGELSHFSLWALPFSFPHYRKSHLDRQPFPSSFHFITDMHHVLKKILFLGPPAKISTIN